MIAPLRVIPPFSALPIDNVPISVPLPITPTDVVPVPASRVTVSILVPPISPMIIFPPVAPVSTVKLDSLASSIFPVAKVILSAAVWNVAGDPISIAVSYTHLTLPTKRIV